MNQVKKFILTQLSKGMISQNEAVALLKEIQNAETGKVGDIAIIGMACRLPMSGSKEEFWENIVCGRSCFVSKPADKLRFEEVLENPHYGEFIEMMTFPEAKNLESFVGGYIPDNDKFDADFFNISPREARYIEPGQRVFMEMAWAAIEDAGYSGSTIRDTLTGVFVGKDYSNSMFYKQITAPDPMKVTGTWEGLLASRVSYAFNLRGPTMVIDTACSSGLVAVHEACNALRNRECDMALAGGISIGAGGTMVDDDSKNSKNNENSGTIGAVTSNDNQVRTFDKKCSGSVFGEGVVVFMLKPFETARRDRDHVYAVIKGSAINNDGASNGITAPNPLAQEAVILDAWKRAGVSAESIDYVEAHGTGTLLGDPIEIIGLTNAFAKQTDRKQFCGIGSVKTNVGHLVAASGCASLMKVSMAMENQLIPPSINFEEPNGNIDFLRSPVYVVDQPTPWNRGQKVRRAGINAFGFSGTNCHMIVEETPAPTEFSSPSREWEIITLSARTETSLHSLIEEYSRFLAKGSRLHFGDMSYTANVGRGHYSYRLAVVAGSVEEFRAVIDRIVAQGFSTEGIPHAHMGKHRIVSDKYRNRTEGEVTEMELHTLSSQARELLGVIRDGQYDPASLDQLAQVYAKGAGVEWEQLYEGLTRYKISLPTYRFDRIVCWADPKVTELGDTTAVSEADKIHPIVERMLSDSMNETVFLAKFDLSKHWFVQEHKIMGSNIVPGTAYIEFVKAVCVKYFASESIQIKSMTFIQPLVVGETPKEAHIILKKLENGVRFTVASQENEERWVVHCEGEACVHDDAPTEEFRVADYAEGGEEIIIPIPEDETDELVYMGPRWHCIEHIYKKGDVLQSEIKLRDDFKADLNNYHYHPSMADAALNIPLQVYINREMYLPLSYRNLRIYDTLPQRFFSRLVKISGGNGSETMSFRVTLADPTGKILAEIEEYTTKKVGKFNSYVANTYYGVRMMPMMATPVPGNVDQLAGNALIFTDASGVAQAFGEQLPSTVKPYYVEIGGSCARLDENRYRVTGDERSYDWLFEELGLKTLEHVFHFGTVDLHKKTATYDDYDMLLNRGLYSLFFFPRAMLRHISGKTAFCIVTDHGYRVTDAEEVKPWNRSVLAITKTLVQEYTNCTFRCIDIADETHIRELLPVYTAEEAPLITAVRKGKLYEEVLSLQNVTETRENYIAPRKDGVYLITGGTGGLGLEIGKYLAETGAGNICLLSRQGMPAQDKWDGILEKNRNRKMIQKISAIREMEALGASVSVEAVDVCDREEMTALVERLQGAHGWIHGVIHCAGVAGDGFLYNKSVDTFHEVIDPKIRGIALLTELLGEKKPDFMILFSSMQSAFGGSGQGDYTAANAFLDAFAEHMQTQGINCKTVNWPGWSETGMAVDYGVSEEMTLFRSLTNKKALIAFDFVMRHDISNVIPGELSMDFLSFASHMLPFGLSTAIRRELGRHMAKNSSKDGAQGGRRFDPDSLVILGKDAKEYTATEKEVALIYAAVLDLTEIDIFENFNAMGGDSIIASEVLKLLNDRYDNLLNISDMFTYSTVTDMAEHIDQKRN